MLFFKIEAKQKIRIVKTLEISTILNGRSDGGAGVQWTPLCAAQKHRPRRQPRTGVQWTPLCAAQKHRPRRQPRLRTHGYLLRYPKSLFGLECRGILTATPFRIPFIVHWTRSCSMPGPEPIPRKIQVKSKSLKALIHLCFSCFYYTTKAHRKQEKSTLKTKKSALFVCLKSEVKTIDI